MRQLTALTLIVAMLLISTPSALANPIADNTTVRDASSDNFSGLASTNLPARLSPEPKPGPGMPPLAMTPPPLVKPEPPPSQAELEARVARLEMNPNGEVSIEVEQSLVAAAIPLDAGGEAVQGLIATWESSDAGIVSVTSDGQATGIRTGTARLTARAGSRQESLRVTVLARTTSSSAATQQRDARNETQAGVSASRRPTQRGSQAQARATGTALRAHRANTTSAAFKPPLVIIDDSDANPANQIGTPPGKTEPGAATPPAAIEGTETPGSSNYIFDVPIASLPGRGVDAGLSLIYNSRLWHKQSDGILEYDRDNNWLAPGFRLGFGFIEFTDTLWPNHNYVSFIADPDGARHAIGRVSFSPSDLNNYVSNDESFIYYHGGPTGGTVTRLGGTRVEYGAYRDVGPSGLPGQVVRSYPTKITDRNGNYILISYVGGVGPRISSMQDTLGRYIYFRYEGNDLVTITVPGYGTGAEHQAIRFYYENIVINPSGSFNVSSTASSTSKRLLRYVYYPGTQSGYRYDYSTPYGMIYRINQLRGMTVSTNDPNTVGSVVSDGQVAAWTEYDYPTAPSHLTDAPKYTHRTDDWAGRTPANSPAPVYIFAVDDTLGTSTITAPDGTTTITTTIVDPNNSFRGYVQEVLVKQGTTELSKTTNTWERGYVTDTGWTPPRLQKVAVKNEANQTQTTLFSYVGRYNNISAVSERDFNLPDGSVGPELRRTETTYEERPEWTSQRLIRLPTSVKVFAGGSNTPASYVTYAYDETALTDRAGVVMHDPAYDSSSTVKRGNLTTTTAYANAASATTPSVTTSAYDILGNVIAQTVNCCQQKTIAYSSSYQFAYPTEATKGTAPDQLTTKLSYDVYTGVVRSLTDENEQVTTFDYYPESVRLYQITRPDTSYTQHIYGDGLYQDPDAAHQHSYVATSTAIGVGRIVRSWSYFDGRGATVRRFANYTDTNGFVTTDTEYDEMGQVRRTSNPYFSNGGAINPAGLWTTVEERDGLGRAKLVRMPDNTTVQTNFAGTVTSVVDQAGRSRRQVADALGRVVRMDEPDAAGNLGTDSSPTQPTQYEYDALGNLTKVVQAAPGVVTQERVFKYDSLGHLTHERQVEATATLNDNGARVPTGGQWTGVFKYNAHGLITDSYDARGVVTTREYDGLNRIHHVSYTGESGPVRTPAVTYTYDQAHNGFYNKGRLTEVRSDAVTAPDVQAVPQTIEAYDYDLMGRVTNHSQTVGSDSYTLHYGYNMVGQLTSETYPSGRVVGYEYDDGARLTRVNRASAGSYVSNITYKAHGGFDQLTLDNGAVQSVTYNARLQPQQIKLTVGGVERQRFDYLYGQVDLSTGNVDATKNRGQMARIEGYIDGVQQWQQRYSYDSLGRLDIAAEHRGSDLQLTWRTDYDYDRFGNRRQIGGQNYNVGYIPVTAAETDGASNRLTGNMTYDDAGNVTIDNKFHNQQYHYDGMGRQVWVASTTTAGESTAVYDGLGQRVQTNVTGSVKTLVYDIQGQLVAEYGGGQATGTGGTRYVMADYQDSTRVVMNQNGTVAARYDYLPFGEEIGANIGQRTPAQGYSAADGTRQTFAGMEKDEASGLDHTLWRKYEQRAGRWTSPDPAGAGSRIADPQSFNAYSYVGNDPVNRTDGLGLYWDDSYWFGLYGDRAIDLPLLHNRPGFNTMWSEGEHDYWMARLDDPEGLSTIWHPGIKPAWGPLPRHTVDKAIREAKERLTGPCKTFFEQINASVDAAAKLANLSASKGGASVGDQFLNGDTLQLEKFKSVDQAAVTSSIFLGNVRQADAVVTFNKDSFFFTGKLSTGADVTTLQNSSVSGLTLDEIRQLIVLHELVHIIDTAGIWDDGSNSNAALNEAIKKACF